MPRRRRIKAPEELHKIEGWLFAILRFAITPEQTNRAFVMAVARQMDRPGSSFRGTQFGFFVRTSIEFCDAIAAADHPEKLASLRHQIKRIDNPLACDGRSRAFLKSIGPKRRQAHRADATVSICLRVWRPADDAATKKRAPRPGSPTRVYGLEGDQHLAARDTA